MSTQSLCKDVLEALECPVCLEYMLPPITFCGNGHNICKSCRQKIQKCPTCRETLSDTRNKSLEKLALKVDRPCPNEKYGCTLTFPIALISEHQDVCQFGPFDCRLKDRTQCEWAGTLKEIKDHVLLKHLLLVRPVTRQTVKKFSKDNVYVDILRSSDNLFFEAYEVIGDAYYYIIQHIGPEEEASQFKYKFILGSGADEITVSSVARSYAVDVQEVYNTGRCVKLFYDTLQRFITEDKGLQYHVEITKVKEAAK